MMQQLLPSAQQQETKELVVDHRCSSEIKLGPLLSPHIHSYIKTTHARLASKLNVHVGSIVFTKAIPRKCIYGQAIVAKPLATGVIANCQFE